MSVYRTAVRSFHKTVRTLLLLIPVFTVINVLLTVFADDYLIFSAAAPFYLTVYALLYTGHMPDVYYEGAGYFVPMPEVILLAAVVVSVLILSLYICCYVFAGRGRPGWMLTAAVMFFLDTVAMVTWFIIDGFVFSDIIDVLAHLFVIALLAADFFTLRRAEKADAADTPADGVCPARTEEISYRPAVPASDVPDTVPAPEPDTGTDTSSGPSDRPMQ